MTVTKEVMPGVNVDKRILKMVGFEFAYERENGHVEYGNDPVELENEGDPVAEEFERKLNGYKFRI